MQHKILSNRYYLEGKLAFLENKHECPYQPGPEKGLWLAGVTEMREELRVLRESLQLQARNQR
jgi:ribosome modulation factor